MTLKDFYIKYPTKNDCISHLEKLRWDNSPVCPYCNSERNSITKDQRYYCNNCMSSFSVTVGTMFHKTRVDLQKWFFLIKLVFDSKNQISTRQLSDIIGVTKDTSWRLLKEIKNSVVKQEVLINKIYEYEQG